MPSTKPAARNTSSAMRSPHWPRALGLARAWRSDCVVSARLALTATTSARRVSTRPCCSARSCCMLATSSATLRSSARTSPMCCSTALLRSTISSVIVPRSSPTRCSNASWRARSSREPASACTPSRSPATATTVSTAARTMASRSAPAPARIRAAAASAVDSAAARAAVPASARAAMPATTRPPPSPTTMPTTSAFIRRRYERPMTSRRMPGRPPPLHDLALARLPLGGESLQPLVGLHLAAGRGPSPRAVGAERPGEDIVVQLDLEHLVEPGLELGIDHRREHLDAPVEVARHQVGRTEQVARAAGAVAVGEPEDAGVLEVAPHDRPHPDRLRQPRHAGLEAADASHDQVDLDPRLRCGVQLLDHLGVDQTVHLHRDAAPAGAGGDLAVDEVDDARPQPPRRHQQPLVGHVAAVAGELVEQLGQV